MMAVFETSLLSFLGHFFFAELCLFVRSSAVCGLRGSGALGEFRVRVRVTMARLL